MKYNDSSVRIDATADAMLLFGHTSFTFESALNPLEIGGKMMDSFLLTIHRQDLDGKTDSQKLHNGFSCKFLPSDKLYCLPLLLLLLLSILLLVTEVVRLCIDFNWLFLFIIIIIIIFFLKSIRMIIEQWSWIEIKSNICWFQCRDWNEPLLESRFID